MAPGPYGILVELYKHYADVLAVRFHAMMVKLAESETLAKYMGEAFIVVIPKLGKGPSCAPHIALSPY